jgi:hypothetical protein
MAVYVGILVGIMVPGQVSLRGLRLFPVSIIPPMLCVCSYHLGYGQRVRQEVHFHRDIVSSHRSNNRENSEFEGMCKVVVVACLPAWRDRENTEKPQTDCGIRRRYVRLYNVTYLGFPRIRDDNCHLTMKTRRFHDA